MILFDDNTGHITDLGFVALENEQLSLDQRLEIAEHLSFCEDCRCRYLAFVESRPLLTPTRPVTGPVMHRIRTRGRVILLRRALRAGLAACLLLALLSVFHPSAGISRSGDRLQSELARNASAAQQLATVAKAGDDAEPMTLNMRISNAIDQLIATLNQKGETKQ
ncbi:MAG TPA: hypothetical protein H9896_01735 [Candidatus Pygmaiobacter gallistercoris]|nr:hypothetical protein [Candidatus Pygmaiobacter gallistercoris]